MNEEEIFRGWVRIDDRLIHGQVTVGWWQHLRYREIWVVDNVLREEAYLWDALRLAAPGGVEVRVMGVDEAAGAVTRSEVSGRGVLVLLREPEATLALVEAGVHLGRVNVGNLGSRPGSVRAILSVSLTRAQIAALDALLERGIEVFFQPAPEDARVRWEAVRKRVVG
jgi:mannose/fructose/N-acetylgalactosamine-specific phosphotransferase system component IIB